MEEKVEEKKLCKVTVFMKDGIRQVIELVNIANVKGTTVVVQFIDTEETVMTFVLNSVLSWKTEIQPPETVDVNESDGTVLDHLAGTGDGKVDEKQSSK